MDRYIRDYPRPQFVRENWKNLNGPWNFAFDDADEGRANRWYAAALQGRRILVPFTYETPRSGIGDETPHPIVWYQRDLTLRQTDLEAKRAILHFEGSDYRTAVWVNGSFVGEHEGGYTRFSFDITAFVAEGENTVTVRAEDFPDEAQPRGKQRWAEKSYSCWYVQTTGIWKTVWMESVPEISLRRIKMTPDAGEKKLSVEYAVEASRIENLELEVAASLHGQQIARERCAAFRSVGSLVIDLDNAAAGEWGVRLWTPEAPVLYDVRFTLYAGSQAADTVRSYFGLRDIRIEGSNILLNGRRLYQRLVLDQGYWPETHLTPPDEDASVLDIERAKALGFNGVRKHQKIEDERWLYWCDVKGLLVWSEAPAAFRFDSGAVCAFTKQWMAMVEQNYNHPCVITWVPFNESWGISAVGHDPRQQAFTEAVYHLTKAMDPMRPVISNDGWEHTVSDILTLHDYHGDVEQFLNTYLSRKDELLAGDIFYNLKNAFARGFGYKGQPVILSECGGFALQNGKNGWGYGEKEQDQKAYAAHLEKLLGAIRALPYVCGYCYTQLTDVQQEINGLLDEQRSFKADCGRIRDANAQEPAY